MPEQLLDVDPAELIIGANVRTDPRTDAKQFAASIKARGVLEAITCHRDETGALVVLRGQRRALVAATVGTPTGTVPVRVVETPADVDRIIDQVGENVHREAMTDAEVCGAVEQLALLGVSAAQITRRTAIRREHVDAALSITKTPVARDHLQAGLGLDDAVVFAEFAHDPDAVATLDRAVQSGHSLTHVAQRLRDTTDERLAIRSEIERLRAEGLPVLEPADVPTSLWQHRLGDLVRADTGEPVDYNDIAGLATANLVVSLTWVDTDPPSDVPTIDDSEDKPHGDSIIKPADETSDEELRAVSDWIVLDPQQAGLVPVWEWRQDHRSNAIEVTAGTDPATAEADREAKRVERRRVIENNKAWDSAETVRREWLATFCTRKTPPQGAEELITAAVLLSDYNLNRSMSGQHRLLRAWLGLTERTWQSPDDMPGYLDDVRTAKRHTMLTLAAVLAAWEEGLSRESWRRSDRWDARVLNAITSWGYQPSPVEELMISNVTPVSGESTDAAIQSAAAAGPETATA